MLTLPCRFDFSYVSTMTCSADGEVSMVAESYFFAEPVQRAFFVYFNKRGDKCKILYWDRRDSVWVQRPTGDVERPGRGGRRDSAGDGFHDGCR